MDRQLMAEVKATVKEAMTEVLESADEIWLTAKQVSERFGMLTKEWLHRYGELLPRERAEVTLKDGSIKRTGWAYPQHKIQRWIVERKLVNLKEE